MTPLSVILGVKVAATVLLWAGPLLILSKSRLTARTQAPEAMVPMLRLYGVALAALCIGYVSAYWPISQGVFPWGVVLMGLVSNGGATITLLVTGAARRQKLNTVVLATITTFLTVAALMPSWALDGFN